MLYVITLLAALLTPALAYAQLGSSPNRPADAVNVVDLNFSSWTTGPVNSTTGQTCSSLGPQWGNGFITADATAPKSPTSILREVKDQSTGIGGMGFTCTFPGQRRVYVTWWMAADANMKGLASNSNKVSGYISQDGFHLFIGPIYRGFGSGSAVTDFALELAFNSMSIVTPGAANNCHISTRSVGNECAGVNFSLTANVNNELIPNNGAWHRYEALYDLGSCTYSNLNCRDGIVRVWVDGTLKMNYTNFNWHPGLFNEVAWSHTWDGQDAGQPNPAGWKTDHYTVARYGTASPPTIVDNPVGAPRAPSGVTAIVQ